MNILREYDRLIPQKCPVCKAQRDNLYYAPIGQDDDRVAIYLSCKKCLASMVFFISQNDMGIMAMGVLTDVNIEEARNFFGAKPISKDDILDIHEHLAKCSKIN
jgi:hypothetical protein